MEKVRYMISDAAAAVDVETHVLRYWEDELGLDVPRNELGHRYYTRDNIKQFMKIKELKGKGYQLRAIRGILHHDGELSETGANDMAASATPMDKQAEPMPYAVHIDNDMNNAKSNARYQYKQCSQSHQPYPMYPERTSQERMDEFRELMSNIVGKAIALNNEELSQQISTEVQETILKEMNYLMREQDSQQEERYKKLDMAIRGNIRRKGLFSKKEKPPKAEKIKKSKSKNVNLNPVQL
ncbi:MerR family transcriptional regulator [Agathobacter sp.]